MTSKPILRLLLLLLLGLAGQACATGLKVGVYENEPKIFTDSRGTASGILIDILEAVAKRENWQLSYVRCEWEDCLRQLQAGDIDLMPDVAYSAERDRLFDFHSTPALHSWSQIYRRDDVEINSAIDLAGKRIALLGGGIQESAVTDMLAGLGIKATLIRTKSVEDGFRLAQANGADAAIAGHYFGDYHKQMYHLVDTPVIFQSSQLFYVTAQGRHPDVLAGLEKHLAAWSSDPQSPYYEAISKWGGHVPDSLIPPAVWKTLLAVTALLLISVFGVVVLRKRVHLKTRQLADSNQQLQRLAKLYAALSQCNKAIVHCADETELFPVICRDAVEFGGMQMAWIGKLDVQTKRVVPVAAFGAGTEYLESLNITIDADQPSGRGPSGTALREDRPFWCQDFANDPLTAPWHERGKQFGWGASASIPLHCHGAVIGILTLYAGEANAFDEPARNLLLEMSMDVSFALERFAGAKEREQMEASLRESEEKYRALTESINDVIWTLDVETLRFTYVSPSVFKLRGYTPAEIMAKPMDAALTPESAQLVRSLLDQHVKEFLAGRMNQDRFNIEEIEQPCKDGSTVWTEVVTNLYLDKKTGKVEVRGVTRNISERKRLEASLLKLSLAVEQSPNTIVITDLDANIEYANANFTKATGYSLDEVIGKNPRVLQSGKTPKSTYDDMWASLTRGELWQGELINRRKDGSEYIESVLISPVRRTDGRVINYLAIKEDITEKKLAEERIEKLAHFDQLTGLPNRSLLNERFKFALSMAQRNGEQLAVMFLDLDHFKDVNDTLGHSVGGQLLMEMAQRLKQALREEDTVSRQGGDEFVLILPDTDEHGAAKVAAKLMEAIAKPCQIDMHELINTPSIGIAIYPHDGEDFETLSRNADTAMYRAKQAGRNAFRFFTAEMQAHSARALQLGNALRQALVRNQLQLQYQPQVSIDDGHVVGVEALLRWQHPELGMISPAEFVPIAEDSGQITHIGEWVLRTAIRQLKDWLDSGLPPMMIAVNLSAAQFRQPNLTEQVTRILDEVGVPHHLLELELTEAVAMDDPQGAIEVMDKLHEHGIRMSIDDFGTGYSSLSYLKRFKVYKLKIDQSFVHDITDDPDDKAIVTAIINMASSLGMQTIAEGVETAGQLAFLRLQGCNEVQGYYFSKPLTAEQLASYLKKPRQ